MKADIIEKVKALKVGGSMDLKLSNITTKEIYRIDKRRFEISCTVWLWQTVNVTKDTLIKCIKGEKNILTLNWQ